MADILAPDVGQMAPDFRLRGPSGVFVTLSEYRGDRHVVLAFYPLAFSPVCSHMLPAIQRQLPRIEALGATVLGISVDSHYANQAFAERLRLSFPLLSDFRRQASAAYGVLQHESGVSGRAVFIVDRDGRIAYRDVAADPDAMAEVPSTERLLAALEALR